jgi:hypothetical protein
MHIKSVLIIVLTSVAIWLVISSYATVSTGWEFSLQGENLSKGNEVKLLSIDILQTGNLSADVEYWVTIKFETASKREISRACFDFQGDGQSCVDVQAKDVRYGSHPYFRVPIHVPAGSKRIDCYAEYIRDEKTYRTNTVTYYVIVLKKPEE